MFLYGASRPQVAVQYWLSDRFFLLRRTLFSLLKRKPQTLGCLSFPLC